MGREMTNKEAISNLNHIYGIVSPDIQRSLDLAIKALEERPQGEWYYNCQNGWHCSLCHKAVKFMPTIMGKANFDFCPNCGADMRKPNCVRCDHFGKCEGCEKGEEE